jgi:hypothetical protein
LLWMNCMHMQQRASWRPATSPPVSHYSYSWSQTAQLVSRQCAFLAITMTVVRNFAASTALQFCTIPAAKDGLGCSSRWALSRCAQTL